MHEYVVDKVRTYKTQSFEVGLERDPEGRRVRVDPVGDDPEVQLHVAPDAVKLFCRNHLNNDFILISY